MGASLYCGTTRILVRISLCLGREYLLAIFLVFQFWVLFLLKYMKEEECAGARERKRERKGRKVGRRRRRVFLGGGVFEAIKIQTTTEKKKWKETYHGLERHLLQVYQTRKLPGLGTPFKIVRLAFFYHLGLKDNLVSEFLAECQLLSSESVWRRKGREREREGNTMLFE